MPAAPIRCLTPDGIREFARYLSLLRDDGGLPPPTHLLTAPGVSRPSRACQATVESRGFANRRTFAKYLDERFRAAGVVETVDEDGMWEWLSLYYFDAVCPVVQGRRRPGVDHRHLAGHGSVKLFRRHLLRGPYLLHREFGGGAAGELDLLLAAPLPVYDAAATSLGERPRVAASRGALTAASRLYFDRAKGRHRRGYTDDGHGIRAFCRFVHNLPPWFDVAALSADTVLALLPREFDRWKPGAPVPAMSPPDSAAEWAGVLDDLLQETATRPLAARHARVRSDLFRAGVLGAYEATCAISGLALTHATPQGEAHEVEAAHIIPVARGGKDLIQNGLALARTVHWAFDRGMLWLNDDLRVAVSDDVAQDPRNAWLKRLRGRSLNLPTDPGHHPHPAALRWHAEHVAGV